MEKEIKQFTKEEYTKIVQQKRKEFIYQHFSPVLDELFPRMMKDAHAMRRCHHDVTFDCPEHFDIDKTELVIQEYFRDLGFETIPDPRKHETVKISLTIV